MARDLEPGVIIPIDRKDGIILPSLPTLTMLSDGQGGVDVKIEFNIPDSEIVQNAGDRDEDYLLPTATAPKKSHCKYDDINTGRVKTIVPNSILLKQLASGSLVDRSVNFSFEFVIDDGKVGGAG